MSTHLKSFLGNYASLTDEDLDFLAQKFVARDVKKRTYLLKEGDVCSDLIFVEKGCLRLFYFNEDVEVSVWFAFEGNSAIDINSFISEKPSIYFIQAIEDSSLLIIPKTEIKKLYDTYPKMQEIMRNYWEDAMLNLLERFTALQRDAADKRYLDLLAKPTYMQKIPQKYLASYIGVTPTSLSRIRKNIR
ncbi:Crp/Fnr family transcriptional regulator [Mucilaginibacter ginkgonis]|uniref:Crp/Fnr family transcriptional regulator n=1 Tax=Mucilaginibacter ginkgonis TaxID=2682091 RepID=A0A6I4HZW4_9SPHI|nr:Crp/Fnr family transcriptional regulator [Mucilaginibacter ginkgonis]QQL48804.1 Crp/Fnr family transcriptional regulator [Mucilaginibacter ginkgonis]